MKPKNLIAWIGSLALTLLVACSFAATNNPGTIYLPGSVPYDHDATNFIVRAGINPRSAEAKAIGRLVYDLKYANLWTNLDALYPFIGNSSNSCAQNLVSTNYGIVWHGGVTFTVNGANGNASDAWGDTGYKQSTRGTLTNNFHLYSWVLKGTAELMDGPVIANQNLVGAGDPAAGGIGFYAGDMVIYPLQTNFTVLNSASYGNALTSRSGAATVLMAEHALATNVNLIIGVPTNSVRLLGNINTGSGYNGLDGYSDATIGAASFGRSLTPAQATNYFTIITRFQTTLRRNKNLTPLTP